MNIDIIAGDITAFRGDAIVNAANSVMLGGGGVDGAIHRAAGPRLREACEAVPLDPEEEGLGPGGVLVKGIRCPVGEVRPTPAFDLPCRWVLHTVAPVYDPDSLRFVATNPPVSLAGMQTKFEVRPVDILRKEMRGCFKKSLLLAAAMGLKSIAFPALGCGVYGWSHEDVAGIAMEFCQDYKDWPVDVTFVLFPADSLPIWEQARGDLGL